MQLGLADAFDDNDLSWKVDLFDWVTTSERWREIIARDGVVLIPCVADAAGQRA